jgi:hypothetical protein
MIKFNDKAQTRIDEKVIIFYYTESTFVVGDTIDINIMGKHCKLVYNSKALRDTDLDLLDKLFSVKYIQNKTENLDEENKPTKEEYLTWKDMKGIAFECIRVKFPNGSTRIIYYNSAVDKVIIKSETPGDIDGFIYNEDLFNALMLKKVTV